MRYSAILAMIAAASAASQFGIVIGSGPQSYNLMNSDGCVYLGDGSGMNFVLNDDGSLIDKHSGKYATFNDGYCDLGGCADRGWSLNQGNLYYKGHDSFTYCPNDGYKLGYNCGCDGGKPITLICHQEVEVDCVYPTNQFTLKAWGGQFQNTPIMKVDAHPHVFSVGGTLGKDVVLEFFDTSSLVDQDERGINLDSSTGEFGNVAPFGRAPATPGFSINGDHLIFAGKDNWLACPSAPGVYSLANNNCIGGTHIVLQVVWD